MTTMKMKSYVCWLPGERHGTAVCSCPLRCHPASHNANMHVRFFPICGLTGEHPSLLPVYCAMLFLVWAVSLMH